MDEYSAQRPPTSPSLKIFSRNRSRPLEDANSENLLKSMYRLVAVQYLRFSEHFSEESPYRYKIYHLATSVCGASHWGYNVGNGTANPQEFPFFALFSTLTTSKLGAPRH